jgi:hypothetical protein
MAFIRAKKKGKKVYYYLVENYREGTKVKQKVLHYLGTTNSIKEKLEKLREKS